MRPIVTDEVALSACLSVGRSVAVVSPAKRLNRSMGYGFGCAKGSMC